MLAGLSSLGVLFGYGLETTAGTKPSAFTLLNRINGLGGINIDPEQIDASALEDLISRYVAGRADTGGTVPITINVTDETIGEWEDVLSAYSGRSDNDLQMWFEVYHPSLTKGFFFTAQPPEKLPMPEMGQNQLLTMEINLTIEDYKGMQTKVLPN